MKTFVLRFSTFAIIFLLLLTAISTPSCKKDKTCHGKVTVIDTAGIPVPLATVKLAAPSVNGQVTYTGITDGTGIVTFEVKLPAIFDVFATQAINYPGMTGVGVIRLDEPGKTAETTVTLK